MRAYYERFYRDNLSRVFVFGINPGRFGAGVTGIPFTDPAALANDCGIANSFADRRELSSTFVYDFIRQWGGVSRFTRDFYLTAVCPFGFTKQNLNVNYYDNPALLKSLTGYIGVTMRAQVDIGARSTAIVLGSGKNAAFLNGLNRTDRLFDRILVLDHPRFIMQYRRRSLDQHIARYVQTFSDALSD